MTPEQRTQIAKLLQLVSDEEYGLHQILVAAREIYSILGVEKFGELIHNRVLIVLMTTSLEGIRSWAHAYGVAGFIETLMTDTDESFAP